MAYAVVNLSLLREAGAPFDQIDAKERHEVAKFHRDAALKAGKDPCFERGYKQHPPQGAIPVGDLLVAVLPNRDRSAARST